MEGPFLSNSILKKCILEKQNMVLEFCYSSFWLEKTVLCT
jgi:hypothetical protein